MNGGVSVTYDVEADWILLTTCNFRCSYCFVPPAALAAKTRVYGTPSQWLEAFNTTGKSWLLHVTGGEPSVYPGFVSLCEHLTRKHYLSINSNLSHRCMDDFADTISPERVHFINAAIHYDERRSRASLDVFVDRVRTLAARGFTVLVSSVMTPALIAAFPEIVEYFEARGLFVIPKVLRGAHAGKRYPASYSKAQRALILEYVAAGRRKYDAPIASLDERPTIDLFGDGRFLNATRRYRGKLCASGSRFVRIDSDGSVVRCGSREQLGNILQKNVSLLGAPKRCDTTYCSYFCEKYTAPPFVPAHASGVSLLGSLSFLIDRALGG